MTTSSVRRSKVRRRRQSNTFVQRVVNFWQTTFNLEDISTLLVALGLLMMPALSLLNADWPLSMGVVLPVLMLSVFFGFLLARSHYNELLALLMSMVYGGCFVLLAAANSEPGGIAGGVYSVFSRTVVWVYDALTGGINQDELVFTMLVATLFWFLGYNVAWHIFRVDRVFRVIMPPGLILVTNTVYYSGPNNLVPYVVIFLFLALLLVVRSNLDAREWEWYISGIRVPRRIRWQVNLVGGLLALLALTAGWLIPMSDLQERLDRFQQFMQSDPLVQFSETWNRLFSTIDAYGPVTADYYGGDTLELSGAIQLGEQEVMRVEAPQGRRYYWRSRVFDLYQNGNWSSQATVRMPDIEPPFEIPSEAYLPGARQPVQQRYTMAINASRLVYAAPQPLTIGLQVRADVRQDAPETTNIYAVRPFRILKRGDTYNATSLISTATAAQLRLASTDYPQWIRDSQLFVPDSITLRTRQLAQQIVLESGAVTPYDQAKAIERWLRANITYNESIPQPPAGQDPVDWVLFDYREGYCNYYASSMVMMLRSLGVPARMGAGFAQGEWNGNAYVVRERDAHTWVEVYFPGYGWVEFEPTAAQAELDRGEDTSPAAPSPTPPATPTPTITPSPSPSPTSEATLPPSEDESRAMPTTTPTLTPTPTATPVILPTAMPPLQPPPPRGPFGFILRALLTGFLGILFILLIVAIGVFIWWWWEWRGMRGLSPVTRAYARLERYITRLLRLPLSSEQTPLERGERIVRELPRNANRPVAAITRLYVEERYGRGTDDPSVVQQQDSGAEKAWQRVRETILSKWFWSIVPFGKYIKPEDKP